jgi:hypothetical protein
VSNIRLDIGDRLPRLYQLLKYDQGFGCKTMSPEEDTAVCLDFLDVGHCSKNTSSFSC